MMNQTDWIKANHGNVCLIDHKGNIVLEPQVDVDTLYYPSHEMCQVKKDGKYGYIDMVGELVIPFQYKRAYPFAENGLAFVVGDNGLGGYIDRSGEYVIAPSYDTGSMFKFGFAAVSKNGEYTYIYKNGSKAINNTFKYAGGFSDCGLAKVVEFNGKHSLMDTTSRVALRLKEGNDLAEFKEGSRITKFRAADGRETLINAAGEIFTGFFEKVVISPYSHLHPYLQNGLWGYVDNEGDEVIPNIYKEVSPFTEMKVAKVKAFHPLAENQEWEFYINEIDEIIDDQAIKRQEQHLRKRFSHINRFKKALALAVKKKTSQTIKSSSKETIMMKGEAYIDESLENDQAKKSDNPYQEIEYDAAKDDRYDEDGGIEFYEVEINFHDKDEEAILEFIREELQWEEEIISLDNNYVKLLWCLPMNAYDAADIEIAMYYALKDGEIVRYSYTQID